MFLIAALVSFASFWLLMSHIPAQCMRRLVGYKGWVDVGLHSTILFLFFGTSTDGLLQAEAAGILFSLYLRAYRWACGYEHFDRTAQRWVRYAGHFS